MHTSTGILQYDPGKDQKHYEAWWALLQCDDEVSRYFAWQLKKYGVEVQPNNKSLWGTHVSVLKGEVPPDSSNWSKYNGFEVEFHYNHLIRYDNGKHAWVDVYSENLSKIREELGFPPKYWYHLTVGRLVKPFEIELVKLVPTND